MTFVKGQSGNPNGKKKGTVSKATSRFKAALNELLESQADRMMGWLEQIDDPRDRFQVIKDFAEYIHPKLSRAENKQIDDEGNAVSSLPVNITITPVEPKSAD